MTSIKTLQSENAELKKRDKELLDRFKHHTRYLTDTKDKVYSLGILLEIINEKNELKKKLDDFKKEIGNELFKKVEEGKMGCIDYHWNGKKIIRDNITFTREELQKLFGARGSE